MDSTPQRSIHDSFLADCERIHRDWDADARSLNTEGLIALYAQDAVLETPLVLAIGVIQLTQNAVRKATQPAQLGRGSQFPRQSCYN